MPTCVWKRYDPQYCLQGELGSIKKKENINMSNQKEIKIRVPYENKVGDQLLLETPRILHKLSITCTGP
jgi:hypothetical protein